MSTEERNRRIEENLPLVKYCVASMHLRNASSGLEFEDLVSHGTLGLIQAVDRFDDSQGVKFGNFAVSRIRGAVLDAMRSLDPVGRTNRHDSKIISDMHNKLALELGRNPSHAEVQQAAGLEESRYVRARTAAGINQVSIDAAMEDGTSLADRLSDGMAPVSSNIEREDLARALAEAIEGLPERDKIVLSLYYVEGLTMSGVAKAMDISETRVSQLLNRTYARLRANRALASAA